MIMESNVLFKHRQKDFLSQKLMKEEMGLCSDLIDWAARCNSAQMNMNCARCLMNLLINF